MDRKPWNQVLLLTADRGNITARSSAAMRARSGDCVAAGDGLSAFGAVFILPVQKQWQRHADQLPHGFSMKG
jgi:hypothetical protein